MIEYASFTTGNTSVSKNFNSTDITKQITIVILNSEGQQAQRQTIPTIDTILLSNLLFHEVEKPYLVTRSIQIPFESF